MYIVQVNDEDGILHELVHIGFNLEIAQKCFITTCKRFGWHEHPDSDIKILLEDGYEVCSCGGAIVLMDTSGLMSDQELVQLFMDKC